MEGVRREEQKYQSASEGGVTTVITVTTVNVAGALTTIIKWLWLNTGVN